MVENLTNKIASMKLENGATPDPEMEEFITTLKSQVEIFVNRMKSNSSRFVWVNFFILKYEYSKKVSTADFYFVEEGLLQMIVLFKLCSWT